MEKPIWGQEDIGGSIPSGKEQEMIEAYGRKFEIAEDVKKVIDGMGQYELACMARFAPAGTPLMCGENGDYLLARFRALGGMATGISKRIGW